jgi:preprotein translocase subunit SecE
VTATRTETAAPRPAGGGRGWGPARFAREVVAELRKVLRPSRKELLTYTAVVIVFVVVLVAIVAGLDVGFAKFALWLFG